MNKKIFITFLVISLLLITASISFALTDNTGNVRNSVMNTGNAIGNAVEGATDTVVNGTKNLVNGVSNVANGAGNSIEDMGNDAENTTDTTVGMLDNTDGNYTATRTATGTNNVLGMSDTTWTWVILAIVGIAIVGLVWYYGAQYEHRSYNND